MKRHLLVLALMLSPAAMADTAADKIAAGRAALVAHDLPTARTRFQEALTALPTSQTAGALLGITRLFDITSLTASGTFLTDLGVATTGRNAYNWTATMPRDVKGDIILPANYNFSQLQTFWQNTLIPESAAARANLAVVSDTSFLITLTAAETKMPMSVNVDYGDVLMARACLSAAEFLAHLGAGQNLNVNLDAVYQVAKGDLLTLQGVLNANVDFLKAGSSTERTAAKTALLDMMTVYRLASTFIRARPAGLNRLFMLDPKNLADEANFRQALDKVELSLTQPVQAGDKYLFTGPLFGATWSLRAQLPVFSTSGFDVTTIPDASLGGVISGFTKEQLADAISDNQDTLAEMGWEWVSPKPQGNSLLRYRLLPSGKHLAVGNAGTYLTSPDGATWTANRIPGAGQLAGLAVNAGKIVSASYDGCIYASTDDAVTWKRVFKSAPSGFHSIVYGGGKYVAVGDYGLVATSVDGDTWDQFYPINVTLLDVLYTGTLFVAVGQDESNGNSVAATSPDGFNWTLRLNTNITNAALWGVAQNGSTLVAVGGNTASAGSSNKRAISTDGGLTWTTGTVLASPTGNIGFNGVAYVNGAFVAAGTGGTIVTSPDGATWTTATSGETFLNMIGVGAAGSTTYVVAGGGVILKSTNNTTFSRTITFSTAGSIGNVNLLALKSIGGMLYAAGGTGSGTTGGVILRSADGQTFTTVSSGHNDIWDIIKQGTTYYAVGLNGTILTSADGASWSAQTTPFTNQIRSITYLNGQFIITGSNDMVRTSPDGTTWTARTTGLGGGQLYGAAYGNGTYVVVGGDNNAASHVATSPDGINWTVRNAGTGNTFRGIVFYQGVFTAVGLNGQISRSNDGINWWWAGSGGIRTNIFSVAVLDGRYYATMASTANNGNYESQSALLMSADGERWVRVVQGTNSGPNRAELFLGRIYTSNAGSIILRTQSLTPQAAPTVQVLTPSTAVNSVTQGSTLALSVTTTSTGVTTYQWKKNTVDIVGATGSGLTLGNIQPGDAGSYTVVVTNAAGSVTSSAITVTVSATPALPVITSNPMSQTVSVGLNASLSVEASGTTPLTYLWKKDGVTVTDGGNVSGATTATLMFTGLTAANGGTYTVVVGNAAGTATSLSAVLTVDSNPAYYFSTLAGLAFNSGTTDATGSAARFSNPHGVAVDASGNVYVSSWQSHTIRKITSGGVVTTIAGQAGVTGSADATGTAATFNSPRGLALDSTGANLYVADTNNGKIRKIVLSTGVVSTFVSLNSPTAVVLDSSGNVYTTSYDHTVRKYSSAAALTTTYGASGQFGSTNGTTTVARFNSPMGIAVDAAGDVYVADSNNAMIRKITTAGVVSTYAGQPQNYGYADGPINSATFSNPQGIAVDAAGNVLVADNSAQVIRKISPAGFVSTIGGQAYWGGSNDGWGGDAHFDGPAGLAVDTSGNLYLAENYSHVIRKGLPSASLTAPVIAASPQSQTVNVGSNVTFGVIASGATTLAYQWRRNGVNLSDGGGVSGATTATLSLPNVQTAAAGSYTVLVSSVSGNALSAPATLTVTVPPTITVQPVAATVTSGQAINLSVTATDTGYITYEWRRNGVVIPGAIYSTYTIPVGLRGDAGFYDVILNGVGGSGTSALTLMRVAPTSYPGQIAVDSTWDPNPLTIATRTFAAVKLSDGKFLVGGEAVRWDSQARTALARLNADLTLDTTWTPPLVNGIVYALAVAPDGTVYVGGDFTAVDGQVRPGLARLTGAGLAHDLTWKPRDTLPVGLSQVSALSVQDNGQIMVARLSFVSGAIAGTDILRRLNADGTQDSSFSVNITTSGSQRVNSLIVEPGTAPAIAFAGTFTAVGGSGHNAIARVSNTGVVDANFGGTAGTNGAVNFLTRLSDGRYLAVGNFSQIGGLNRNRIALLTSAGAVDTNFVTVTSGTTNGPLQGAAILSDGRIIAIGSFSLYAGIDAAGVVRLNGTTGAIDTAFTVGAGSQQAYSPNVTSGAGRNVHAFTLAGDKVALVGTFSQLLGQRRVATAIIDGAVAGADASTVSKTLAAVPSSLVYRPAFTGATFLDRGGSLTVMGSIDVLGATSGLGQIVRIKPDGSRDTTFPAGGSGFTLNGLSTFGVYRAALQADGKYVAIGDFASYNGSPVKGIVRINPDGSLDDSFNAGGGPSNFLLTPVALSGGRVALFGSFGTSFTYNGILFTGNIMRLQADGMIDFGFNPGSGFSNAPSAVMENPDKSDPATATSLLVGGAFTNYNGATVPGFIRLNSDGSRDSTFNSAGAGPTGGAITGFTYLGAGRLAIYGSFTAYNGTTVNRLAIINAQTGALDGASITAPAAVDAQINHVHVQEDGKFIVAGDFSTGPAFRLLTDGTIDSSFALRGITGIPGGSGGARFIMADDGSLYLYNALVSLDYGVPRGIVRFKGAATAPAIALNPVGGSLALGSSVTLSVRATGTGPYTYQWRKNGANIGGAIDSVYVIPSATTADYGSYDVIVTNSVSSVTSSAVTLSDPNATAPTINTQPSPAAQVVNVGANVTYTVVAGGTAPLTYQWKKDATAIAGATSATLALTNVQPANSGSYTVVVSNAIGNATSAAAVLTVQSPYLGTYFGTLAAGGNWALYVRADNTATYIAYVPSRNSVIVVNLTVGTDGTFTVTGTEILPLTGAVGGLALGSPEDPVRKVAVDGGFTLTGQISLSGTVTGQFTGVGNNPSISGAVDPATGPVSSLAGLYSASALGTASGATYAVVGASGQAVVVTTTPTSIGGATGTVSTSGQLTATTSSNAQLIVTINAATDTVSASVTPAGSSTPITYSGLQDTVTPNGYLVNLSVRAAMAAGQTLIVGFVVDGGAKPMLVRAAGPALNNYGLIGVVDPKLSLYHGTTFVTQNEDWDASLASTFATLGAFPFTAASKDSALLQTINGPHSAQATATGPGAVLVEAYDADASPTDTRKLVNLSTRFQVGTGDNILIAGFVLSGTGTRQLLIRAVGPTLTNYGVTGVLVNPQLSVFDKGTSIASNDDWSSTLSTTFTTLGAFPLNAGSKDAATVVTLQAGKPYSVQVTGVGNTTGEALIEIYLVP
jgi:uncharacterized delta-60 repeat protein